MFAPPGGLEPPTFRLTAERASQLRHGGMLYTHIVNSQVEFIFSESLGLRKYRAPPLSSINTPLWSSG